MSFLHQFASGLRSLFRKKAVDQDLENELDSFLEMAAEEKIRQGFSRSEALRAVRLERGHATSAKDQVHSVRWESFLESLWQDLRFALRQLRKNPGFTAVAVLTLALGIGATTAIFCVLNAVLLESIPVQDPQQLVVLQWSAHQRPKDINTSSFGDCVDLDFTSVAAGGCSFSLPMLRLIREQLPVFSGVAAFAGPAPLVLTGNGSATFANAQFVSGDYFRTLGVSAALGRTLDPADEKSGAEPVVVISYAYWKAAFGANAAVIGKTIKLNGVPFSIVGVADPAFTRLTPGKSPELWLSLVQVGALRVEGGDGEHEYAKWWLTIVGRLAPGVSLSQAQAATHTLFRNSIFHDSFLKEADDPRIALLPAQRGLAGFRNSFSRPLFLLMAAVSILLLITCANIAGLLLSRSVARSKEIAVRIALGATRARVARQLLTESLLLAFAGAAIGVVSSFWFAAALASFVVANRFSNLRLNLAPDPTVFFFSIGITVATALVFGLAPAIRGTRLNLTPILKESSPASSGLMEHGARRLTLGSWLVVAQVALSVIVLAGAGLVVRSLQKLRSIDPGFDTANVLQFGIDPSKNGTYQDEQIDSLYREFRTRLSSLPGVLGVTYTDEPLLDGGSWTSDMRIEGHSDQSTIEVQMKAVGPDYFSTLRIPVLTGRVPNLADISSEHAVAVVNRSFVAKLLENREPLGLHFGYQDPKRPQFEIVGVVADTRYDDLRSSPQPIAFIPLKHRDAYFAIRTASNPLALLPQVRSTLASLDNNLPISDVRTQTERINRLLFYESLVARLSSIFGLAALLLACIGLYGLLSYEVTNRTKEIGVRSALGASKTHVLRLIAQHGLTLVSIGIVLGILASFGLTRFLQSLLYEVRPTDSLTLCSVSGLLLIVGAAACWIPARRAASVDPIIALRHE